MTHFRSYEVNLYIQSSPYFLICSLELVLASEAFFSQICECHISNSPSEKVRNQICEYFRVISASPYTAAN